MDEEQSLHSKKTILNLYAIFGVSILLSVLPYGEAAIVSLVFLFVVLIGAYATRKKALPHSLNESHAIYLIRTIWISGLLGLLTLTLASLYMIPQISHTPFEACTNTLTEKGVEWIESASMNDVYAIMQPCIDGFIAVNKMLLIMAMLIAGGPVVLYMAFRLSKGLSRALKGYRLADDKTWF